MTDATTLAGETGREIGETWLECWMSGECVEIDYDASEELPALIGMVERSGASGWCQCRQIFIGRKPEKWWSSGESYAAVWFRQAMEGRVSHRAAGLQPGLFALNLDYLSTILRAKDGT